MLIDALAVALALKASVGIWPWDAMTQAISLASTIKVGTIGMGLNALCVLIQIVVLRKEFEKSQILLQILLLVIHGNATNIFYYGLLGEVEVNGYPLRFAIFLLSLVMISATAATLVAVKFVAYPLERACLAVSAKTGWAFYKIRWGVDIAATAISVVVTLVWSCGWVVGIGTVVSMALFSPLINILMKVFHKPYAKAGLIEEEI